MSQQKLIKFLVGIGYTLIITSLLNQTFGSFYTLLELLITIGIATAVTVIFIENRSPHSTISWLAIFSIFPKLALILYILFGRSKYRRNRITNYTYDAPVASYPYPFEKFGAYPGVTGTKVDVLQNGDATFTSIKEAILRAEHYIYVEYYIYRGDKIGTELRNILIQKAQQGVEVRFLYDGLGSHGLKKAFLAPMQEANIIVRAFDPILSSWLQAANYRNHRKIVIVDGYIGFTGGLNVGDEYLGRSPRMGFWRDTHLRLEGTAVHQLQHVFLRDWSYATGTALETRTFPEPVPTAGIVQIADSGPDTKDMTIRNILLALIANAKSSIWIVTPYFVPDQELFTALRLQALAGRDVRLLYPGKSDSSFSDYASQSYFAPLLQAGVSIYRFKENFVHAKAVLIDENIASIGTSNMDIRSFALNYEVNVFLYNNEAVYQLYTQFQEDFSVSHEIDRDTFLQRSISKRIRESIARLLSPLL